MVKCFVVILAVLFVAVVEEIFVLYYEELLLKT